MSDAQSRRLALPVAPGVDEVLPGYLLRVAGRHGLTLADLTRGRANTSNPAFGLLALRDPAACRDMAQQLGLHPDEFRALEMVPPIQRDMVGAAVGSLHSTQGLLQASSRACPECLHDGIWRKQWRVAGLAACLEHRLMLSGLCNDCGTPWFSGTGRASDTGPRRGPPLPMSWVPVEPFRCHAVVEDRWCGADIREQPRPAAPDHVVEATRVLMAGYGDNPSWWFDSWLPVWKVLKPRWQDRLPRRERHARVVEIPVEPDDPAWTTEVVAATRLGLGAVWWLMQRT